VNPRVSFIIEFRSRFVSKRVVYETTLFLAGTTQIETSYYFVMCLHLLLAST
jgi:hypothetical protein